MANPTPNTEPAKEQDVEATRAVRGRALRWGAASGVIARVVSVSCTLATVPIALRHLGAEGYGLWMTFASLAFLLGLCDLGLGLGARNFIADAFGADDLQRARVIWLAATRRLAFGGLLLALIGVSIAQLFDWPKIFRVTDPALATEVPGALALLAILSGLALPFSLVPSLAAGLQRPWLPHVGTALGGVLLLAATIVAVQTDANLLAWVGIIAGLPVAINAGMGVYLFGKLGWSLRSHVTERQPWPRELGTLSLWFFVPQAGAVFAQTAPPMLLAVLVGPEAVAGFNLLQRIFGLIGQVHWMVVSAWWPAYAEAKARFDFSWIRSSHRWSWWVTVGIFVPGTVVAALVAPGLIQAWVGAHAIQPASTLIWLVAMWQIFQLLGQPPALLLNGLSRIKGVAIYSTIGHIISLFAMLYLGRRNGDVGVITGMMLGYAAFGLPCILIDAIIQLRKLGRE